MLGLLAANVSKDGVVFRSATRILAPSVWAWIVVERPMPGSVRFEGLGVCVRTYLMLLL